MSETYHFTHSHPFSVHSLTRALGSIESLDNIVRLLQVDGLPPLPSSHVQELIDDGPDSEQGWKIFNEMKERFDSDGYKATKSELNLMLTCMIRLALHHAVHSMLAHSHEESSDHFALCEYLRGGVTFLIWGGDDAIVMAAKGRDGAKVTNSIYEPTKVEVFAWCTKSLHTYRSTDAAARVVTELFGVGFDTARKYIKEYKATAK